jgi:hypothetical protein
MRAPSTCMWPPYGPGASSASHLSSRDDPVVMLLSASFTNRVGSSQNGSSHGCVLDRRLGSSMLVRSCVAARQAALPPALATILGKDMCVPASTHARPAWGRALTIVDSRPDTCALACHHIMRPSSTSFCSFRARLCRKLTTIPCVFQVYGLVVVAAASNDMFMMTSAQPTSLPITVIKKTCQSICLRVLHRMS